MTMTNDKRETYFTDIALVENIGGGSHIDSTASPLSREDWNPSHKGPRIKRSCTDVFCCLIFLVFMAGLVVVGYFAFVHGDPELLIYPKDSEGNLCGLGKYKDKKYLLFFDLIKCGRMGPGVFVNGCPTPQVCVEKCPTTNYVFLQNLHDKSQLICRDGVDKSKMSVKELVIRQLCAAFYLKSKSIINRCVPIGALVDMTHGNVEVETSEGNVTLVEDMEHKDKPVSGAELKAGLQVYEQFLLAKEYGEKIVADVVASWWMILIGLLLAMVLSMIWIVLMRWIASFMVWLTLIFFISIFAFLTAGCIYMYLEVKGSGEELTFNLMKEFTFKKEDLYLTGSIVFGVIFVAVFVLVLGLLKRIRIATALVEQGSRAVAAMWYTLYWPIIPFLLQIASVVLFVAIGIYLASIGRNQDLKRNNVTYSNGSINEAVVKQRSAGLFENVPCDTNGTNDYSEVCGFIKNGEGDYVIFLQLYNLFMLFWLVNFISAMGQLTLAGSFASWYWTWDKSKDLPRSPVTGAFYRCFRYHLGSLAFGSLLIASVALIRTILEYVHQKVKKAENRVAAMIMKCLKCLFWCLEKFIRFLNKNAFIMMGVHGKNFCTSAKDAFDLLLRNIARVFVIDKVSDFLMFVCKLVIVGCTGIAAYFFFNGNIAFVQDYNPKLNFYLVPTIIVIVGAYIIAGVFFSVYEMAVDTLFLCFLEDLEINDGSPDKPYFMGKDLMNILGKEDTYEPKK